MTDDPDVTTHRGDSLPPAVLPPPTSGRYALGAEIARGGMGVVLHATDTVLARGVAVKVLQEQFGPDSGTARRFADEARIAGQLQHPGIPPIHDFGTLPDGRPFLAMKLIRGDTLDRLLADRPDPAADRGRFVAVFEAVCHAVAFAHANGVIHRDLKPANVMVGAFGEVQVMDWGLAKQLRSAECGVRNEDAAAPIPQSEFRIPHSDETQAGAVLGTPAYMAPEQAAGAVEYVDARSDVFALGGLLAAVLTGAPPFRGATVEATRVQAERGQVDDCFARLDASGAEPGLVALAKRCLSPARDDRPADAAAVGSAVGELRQAAEARARQAELDRATAEATVDEGRKRRRVQLGLAAAVVLLVAGAGAVAVWRVDEDGKRRAEAVQRDGEERERRATEAADADRRARADRDREQRAADAVAALLDQSTAALEAGDAARAAPLLDQAAGRAADGAGTAHAARLATSARALATLRALDAVTEFGWTADESKDLPSPERVAARWAAAFAGFGLTPGTTPPAEAAARLNESPVRSALLTGLDGWLARSRSAAVRDLLAAADPDPFRDEVRRLLAAGGTFGLVALAGRDEWAAQPSGLVLAFGGSPAVPAETRRELLRRLTAARRTDFAVMMQLGSTYPFNTAADAGERARWFQAAVALRPGNATALLNLGVALSDHGEPDAAAAVFREAARFDPTSAFAHGNLGTVLRDRGEPDAAAAAFREAIRLDPRYAPAHNGLGTVLRDKGESDAAAAAFREAIRLDPTSAHAHNNLGTVHHDRGELDAAAAAYREAVRLDPKSAPPHNGLGVIYETRHDLGRAEAAYREAVRLNPRYAAAHANLGEALRKQARPAAAAAAYRAALALDATIGYAREGLDYCERVQRGEVPTAPPPRAVAR